MHKDRLTKIIKMIAAGELSESGALEELRRLPFTDLGFAKVDHHRALRTGQAEVIFCPGKTPEQAASIARELSDGGHNVLATKAGRDHYEAIRGVLPQAKYNEIAGIISLRLKEPKSKTQNSGIAAGKKNALATTSKDSEPNQLGEKSEILVISAGTSDQPIAEEAAVTAEFLGSKTERLYDVGVAGVHRLLSFSEKLNAARVIVVAAGMEGALPSLVAGLVKVPVIAVPTSIGYGAGFGGLAALLGMLNSCAPGVSVVNIDNGFGAGYLAHVINSGVRR